MWSQDLLLVVLRFAAIRNAASTMVIAKLTVNDLWFVRFSVDMEYPPTGTERTSTLEIPDCAVLPSASVTLR